MPRQPSNRQPQNMVLKPYVSHDIIAAFIWQIRFNMRTLNDVIGKLPAARRQKVEARAQELIAEQLTLQDIRKARKLTQEQMATSLNIGQDSISRLEKRSDMMLSTMRGYIEAMGGSLELVARFPKRAPVIIASIADVSPQPKAVSRRRKAKAARG